MLLKYHGFARFQRRFNLPANTGIVPLIQRRVRFGERLGAEESRMCRERARVGGFDDDVFVSIDERKFADGEISPKDENEVFAIIGQCLDGRVGEGFPTFSAV